MVAKAAAAAAEGEGADGEGGGRGSQPLSQPGLSQQRSITDLLLPTATASPASRALAAAKMGSQGDGRKEPPSEKSGGGGGGGGRVWEQLFEIGGKGVFCNGFIPGLLCRLYSAAAAAARR